MEELKQTITQVSGQMPKSLNHQQISTPTTTSTLSREQHAALFAVINKSRMLNGWQTRTAQELDQTIRTWGEMMNHYQIPISAYPELYQRGFDVRQSKMQKGGDVPQMDATLLVSQWNGEWGLRAELRQREVDQGRTLNANAESVCQRCFGTGWESVMDGAYTVSQKCDHGNGDVSI